MVLVVDYGEGLRATTVLLCVLSCCWECLVSKLMLVTVCNGVWHSVDVCTEDGWTPLMSSCGANHSDCVELLLATGHVDVNKTKGMRIALSGLCWL